MKGLRHAQWKAPSRLEHDVMEILWAADAMTAEEIRQALAPKRVLNDSTVRTILRRLETKGLVSRNASGRALLYTATYGRTGTVGRAVRNILDRFCGGSLETLLVGMVESEVANAEELEKLSEKIASERRNPGSGLTKKRS